MAYQIRKENSMKNKGFSLVELIIIVTIITILAVSIAPALLKYIDKSRKSDDVAAADAIGSALKACMANEDIYDTVMARVDDANSTNTYVCTPLLVASGNDSEWTVFQGSSTVDLTALKEEMDKSCPPEKLKFRKIVNPANNGYENADYVVGSWNEFNPNGWLVCIAPTNEPCVYVTDGSTDSQLQGVSLNPLECDDYK